MKNLTSLGLKGSAIRDISTLGTLDALTHLNLNSTGITDLSFLPMFKQLRELYMNNTAVSDLSPLAELELFELDLSYTTVSDIVPLANAQQLKWVDLSNTGVTDVTLLYAKNWLTFFITNIGPVIRNETTPQDVSRQLEEYRGNIHRTFFEHLWLTFSPGLQQES